MSILVDYGLVDLESVPEWERGFGLVVGVWGSGLLENTQNLTVSVLSLGLDHPQREAPRITPVLRVTTTLLG